MHRLICWLLAVYLFIYVWAVPMLMLSLVPAWGTWMGGFLLILQGSLLALWLLVNAGLRGGVAALVIALLSTAIEHVGVTTGWPFGRYTYTEVLGIKVAGAVPLPIPFAWLLVVPTTIGVAFRLVGGGYWWRVAVVAPLLALGLDFLLEPVAAYIMNYWHWLESGPYYGVPTVNFLAWGSTALVLTVLTLLLTGRQLRTPSFLPALPMLLYFLNLVQFTLVDLAHGYYLAAAIGAAILVVAGWLLRRELHVAWREGRRVRRSFWREYVLAKPD